MKESISEKNARLYEKEIRKCLEDNLTLEACSAETGLSTASFARYCKILGLNRKRKKVVRVDERDEIVFEKRKHGASLQEIGEELGITRERVRQILNKKFPEVVMEKRVRGFIKCPVCDSLRRDNVRKTLPHCSTKCSRLDSPIKNHETWNREMAVKIMRLRDQGEAWEKINLLLFSNNVSNNWLRAKMMTKGYLFSLEEWGKYFPNSDQKERIGYRPK